MNKLSVINIEKKFRNKNILSNVSFSCSSGETIGIIGPNGAGKSTLFKILVGIIKPTRGEVLINEYNTWSNFKSISHKVGVMIESPSLYKDLTGRDNLDIFYKMNSSSESKYNSKIIDMLEIEGYLSKKVREYSLGMKQRLGIACSLIHSPEIVILDEPTNSLDAIGIKLVRDIIKDLNKKNCIVIMSSHNLKEIEEICTSYIMINQGKVADISSTSKKSNIYYKIRIDFNEKLFESIDLRDFNLIHDHTGNKIILCSSKELDSILRLLATKNIDILDIQKQEENLENYFLEKVVQL